MQQAGNICNFTDCWSDNAIVAAVVKYDVNGQTLVIVQHHQIDINKPTGNSITVDDNDNLALPVEFYSQFGDTYPYSPLNCNYECTYFVQASRQRRLGLD